MSIYGKKKKIKFRAGSKPIGYVTVWQQTDKKDTFHVAHQSSCSELCRGKRNNTLSAVKQLHMK